MQTFLFFRIVFALLFVGTLVAGGFLLKNFQTLFGVDPTMPSEGQSSRAYSKVQIFSIWAHAVLLTGALALFL